VTLPEVRCAETVTIGDERWGSFVSRCELAEGHDGDHRSERTACDPPAYLAWPSITPTYPA